MTGPDRRTNGVVIVGASVAGVRTAQALRRGGCTAAITLVGAEAELPYDKPPLSKGVLAGTTRVDAVRLLTQDAVRELDLDLRLGAAANRLDVAARTVVLADGTALRYDDLVIATGARARPSPWRPDGGVHVLRSLDDCRALRADLDRGGPVVVVGAGFIGSEVASTCRSLGLDVTLVDPAPVPMARLLGDELGDRMTGLHHRHGARTRFGVGVEAVTGHRGDLTVQLSDGTALACATAVVGIGAIPNDGWLADSGLVVDDGVVCDEFGGAGVPNVHALGDVARWHHPGRGRADRAEHWTNAVDQARCVAGRIMSAAGTRPHAPVDFVWSDQYDWKLHIIGAPAEADRSETVELQAERDVFATLFGTPDGALCGGVVVNWSKASIVLRRSMASGTPFAATLLALQALADPVRA